MSKKQSLCCSMIVKNCENTIERALRSIEPFCRQIVVVDTGSLDTTPSIASRLGAEVHFFEWTNDFAEARNYALKFARTDWVIILDSDEELISETLTNNLQLFNMEAVGGIRTVIKNLLANQKTDYGIDTSKNISIIEHKYTRIFKLRDSNGSRLPVRFTGKIHEQISDSIVDLGYDIIDSDITINHYGYFEKNPEKIHRNLEMIKKELENKPDDLWILFHLGETMFSSGNFNESEEIFFKLIDNFNKPQNKNLYPIEHYEMARIRIAQIELQRNNFRKVEELLDFESKDLNRDGFRLYLLTVSYLLSNNLESAKKNIDNPSLLHTNMLTQNQITDLISAINKIQNLANK